MELTYFGLSCFRIKTRDAVLVTDPFDPKSVGISMPSMDADIVLFTGSRKKTDCSRSLSKINLSENRELAGKKLMEINEPGEYEVGGIFVRAYRNPGFYVISSDSVNVCYMGMMGGSAAGADFSGLGLGNIDYLIVPVGDAGIFIDWKKMDKLIKDIDPAIVVPSCYRMEGMKDDYLELKKVEDYLSEFGSAAGEPEKKLKLHSISREEDRKCKIVVLEKRK